MTITARFVPNRLPAAIDAWQRGLESEVLDGLEQIGELGALRLRSLSPEGPTLNYVAGIGHTVDRSSRSVAVGSRAPHAHLVEKGREPGKMPPPQKLAGLLGVPKREAFLVARAIGKSGTEGHHVVELTARSVRADVDRVALTVLAKLHARR